MCNELNVSLQCYVDSAENSGAAGALAALSFFPYVAPHMRSFSLIKSLQSFYSANKH